MHRTSSTFCTDSSREPLESPFPSRSCSWSCEGYREEIQSIAPEALAERAEDYLTKWCSNDSRYLMRFYDKGSDVAQFQLTPHTEDTILFLDGALQKDFGMVATESRIRLVLQKMEEIVVHSSDDVEARLNHLTEKRNLIDDEIAEIKKTGRVSHFESAQIRESFHFVLRQLKELLGDFRTVEERFKAITREVQKRQIADNENRGQLLGFALDEEDCLKQDDQGASFYAFVKLILSHQQQATLQDLTAKISALKELADHREGLKSLRNMIPMLLDEAKKILSTNQRLTTALRRLLDEDAAHDRRHLRHLLREIKGLASKCATNPPGDKFGIEIDRGVAISNPFTRTFWSPPQVFESIKAVEHDPDPTHRDEAFRLLVKMARLDWRGMRNNIRVAVDGRQSVSLPDLLEQHPPRAGAIELLGYLQIAKQDAHYVDNELTDDIVIVGKNYSSSVISLPRVVFRNPN